MKRHDSVKNQVEQSMVEDYCVEPPSIHKKKSTSRLDRGRSDSEHVLEKTRFETTIQHCESAKEFNNQKPINITVSDCECVSEEDEVRERLELNPSPQKPLKDENYLQPSASTDMLPKRHGRKRSSQVQKLRAESESMSEDDILRTIRNLKDKAEAGILSPLDTQLLNRMQQIVMDNPSYYNQKIGYL